MDKFFKALLLGTAAGILDAIPMVMQGLSWQANVSAVLHWMALGVIITFTSLPFAGWMSGIIIALLTGIPIAVLASKTTPTVFIPITISSILLGGLLGYLSENLIKKEEE